MRSKQNNACLTTILGIILGLLPSSAKLHAAAPPWFVRPIASVRPKGEPWSAAWFPDGKTIGVSRSSARTALFDSRLQLRKEVGDIVEVCQSPIAISPDGHLIAILDKYAIQVWDLRSNKRIATLMQEQIAKSVAFSPDGRWLAIGTETREIGLWEVKDRKWIATITSPGKVWDLQFSPDSSILAATFVAPDIEPGGVLIFETGTWKQLRRYQGHLSDCGRVAVTNTLVASVGQYVDVEMSPFPGAFMRDILGWEVRLWEPRTGKERGRFGTLSGSFVHWITFSADGKRLAVGDCGGTVTLWDTSTRRLRAEIPPGAFEATDSGAFSPDGRFLLVVMREPAIKRWLPGRILLWSVPELLEAGPHSKRIRFD